MTSFDARRKKLRSLVREANADALLVTSFTNVTYLTGFTGDDSYLLVTLDGETLITDPALYNATGGRVPWVATGGSRSRGQDVDGRRESHSWR